MDAGKKQLADILNGNRVLEVPYYQRSYVWKEEQWARFISDMEYITSTNKDYFLGSIILKQQPTGISPFDIQSIIDGQQRFTTFALLQGSLPEDGRPQNVRRQIHGLGPQGEEA